MITVGALFAFVSGAAANQLDAPLSRIPDRGWELIARYVVGIVAMYAPFALIVHALNPRALRDASLAFWGAAVGVGLGVATARAVRDISEATK